ncbi:MAG: porin family protein [Salinivirgaceae bacterium]|jgi:hypothetical protein
MKKSTIFTSVLFLFSAMVLNAQEMKYGVKGSFLASTFSSTDDGMYGFRPGYSVGGYFQYNLSDELGVSVEPAYALKGANKFDAYNLYDPQSPLFWNGTSSIKYKQHDISLSVIEVPVLVHLNMSVGNGSVFRIFTGPSIDFITKATLNSTREYEPTEGFVYDFNSAVDVTDRFSYVDYGIQAGVGFDIDMEPVGITLEIKYRYGFSDVNNVEGKPSMNSQNIAVSLGIGLEKLFD